MPRLSPIVFLVLITGDAPPLPFESTLLNRLQTIRQCSRHVLLVVLSEGEYHILAFKAYARDRRYDDRRADAERFGEAPGLM